MAPANRRNFLGGLVRLPLIGGGVTLIGQPSAVAEPVTTALLETYKSWLEHERLFLSWTMAGDRVHRARYGFDPAAQRSTVVKAIDRTYPFDYRPTFLHLAEDGPASRAALVLSTVGCDWKDGGR